MGVDNPPYSCYNTDTTKRKEMTTMKVKVWYRPEVVCVEVEVDEAYRRMLDDHLPIKEYGAMADVLLDEVGEFLPADADYIVSVEDAATGEIIVDC